MQEWQVDLLLNEKRRGNDAYRYVIEGFTGDRNNRGTGHLMMACIADGTIVIVSSVVVLMRRRRYEEHGDDEDHNRCCKENSMRFHAHPTLYY